MAGRHCKQRSSCPAPYRVSETTRQEQEISESIMCDWIDWTGHRSEEMSGAGSEGDDVTINDQRRLCTRSRRGLRNIGWKRPISIIALDRSIYIHAKGYATMLPKVVGVLVGCVSTGTAVHFAQIIPPPGAIQMTHRCALCHPYTDMYQCHCARVHAQGF